MRNIVLVTVVLLFCPTFGFSADMRVKPVYKAPVAAPSAYNWTGCYFGGNVGYGWERNHSIDVDVAPFDAGTDTGSGIVGGGQAGCDLQIANNWVLGVQGMFNGSGVEGSHQYSGTPTETLGFKAKWFGSLTGRIGYAVQSNALLYLRGGAAWARHSYTDVDTSGVQFDPYAGSASATRSGWTIGGGIEYAFQKNWSVFAEYSYIDLGSRNVSLTYNCGAICGFNNPYPYKEQHRLQTVLFGINYRLAPARGPSL
jgi:outer membrane immunogenic protein